jgi:4-hydroxybenzoate polyprenyltransferase
LSEKEKKVDRGIERVRHSYKYDEWIEEKYQPASSFQMAPDSNSFKSRLVREATLMYAFTRGDWSASLLPGYTFALPAFKEVYNYHQSLSQLALSLLTLIAWVVLFIYSFDLNGQIVSIEEDKINKPGRPLCTGLVTPRGAQTRFFVTTTLFLALALVKSTLLAPTICWILTTRFLSHTTYGNHWIGKNTIAMSTGTWSLLAGSWRAVGPTNPEVDRQAIYIALYFGITSQIQDLRDVKGDLAVGRRTLPIAFGDKLSRWLIVLGFVPAAGVLLVNGGLIEATPASIVDVAMHFLIVYRVLNALGKDDAKYDGFTYAVRVPAYISALGTNAMCQLLLYAFEYLCICAAVRNVMAPTLPRMAPSEGLSGNQTIY